MLKSEQVLEIHATLFDTYMVIDRFRNGAGEVILDRYECASSEELLSVLDALGCDFRGRPGE